MRARAYLGLGGNIGDPAANMAAALRRIDARDDTAVAAVSRLYRTPPWGKTDQPDFVNACAAVDTTLSPPELLALCLATERAFKRERRERWGPRTLDLDVLDYAGMPHADETLTLPHPRVTERAFVLVPLGDIAPELTFDGRSVADWIAAADPEGITPASADGQWWRER
ncbi:2-amino-4-hydroxy-6-hydroxymethyldihydropteridine diphosphokinase [Aurantimonas sp. A2-1-M11]|uniref:2-amino-4-hydroxy-6- hydroxymethyldihydropteridine diphosphokinase n=1 Tax=Aurantimonas sp. A2-1-M11 TaxID=3113712 RepID=UPI002F91E94D